MTLIKMSVSQMTFSQKNTFIVVLSFIMLNVDRLIVVAPSFPLWKKNDWPDKIIGSNGEEDSFSSFQFVSCRKKQTGADTICPNDILTNDCSVATFFNY